VPTYQEARAQADALNADATKLGQALQLFPRSPAGLVTDETRLSPEYQAAKQAYAVAFKKLRDFNAVYTKRYAKEIAADRAARRQAK
jgi:hypothetical protein